MQNVSTIILDLGGVLLNLDYSLTKKAFADLGVNDFDAYYTQFKASPLFDDLETGRVTNADFFDALRHRSGISLTDDQIAEAWNAMLLDFPTERLAFLEELRNRYKVFLLSNTNDIHHQAFQEIFRKATGGKPLDSFFEKAYYSHLIGARKPETEAFKIIIEEQHLDPERTLFIDDTALNLEGAKALGMQTIHLQTPATVEKLGL